MKRVNLVLALVVMLGVGGILVCASTSDAAVTALDTWTNIYSSAPNNSSGTITTSALTVSGGSNRLFLAAVCAEISANIS
jgi:hypothetical protein